MSCEHEVRFTIKPTDDACRFHFDVRAYKDRIVAPDEYTGVTEVTPSGSEQVLATKDKLVRDDITIFPAPTEYLSTDHNGTFTPSSGKVGFYQVDVDVNPDLRPLSVSENGQYSPDGFDGYDEVTVNVPQIITPTTMYAKSQPSGDIIINAVEGVTDIWEYTFSRCKAITSVTGYITGKIGDFSFTRCSSLKTAHFPNAAKVCNNAFRFCSELETVVFENLETIDAQYAFGSCFELKKADFGEKLRSIATMAFFDCRNLEALIIRNPAPCSLYPNDRVWQFDGSSFDTSGTGGTLYIPKSLYDHLGDGTSLDYMAKNKWGEILSRPNNQVLPIEGSPYEHYYADGTPIS